jgi:hypothetical protein
MRCQRALALSLVLGMFCAAAIAKDKKKKILLPADVLEARTVLVVVDPDAGMSPEAPYANRTAQEDVEKALLKWGRFELATNVSDADLVIEIRKGSGKIAQPTIGGMPTNSRPVVLEPTDGGGRASGGTISPLGGQSPAGAQRPDPSPQLEVGAADDVFAVYRGKRERALDASAVWRYSARDALSSPAVPAVDRFKKLIAEAEKQQASNP